MESLLKQVRQCQICAASLPNPPRPILQVSERSKIIIIGQAPGRKVQESGIPWDDASGDELRRWLGVGRDDFYDSELFGLVPMGFCYPGKGKSGDMPPRPECAAAWHDLIMSHIEKPAITLLIGQYSQQYYLRERCKASLTETVKAFDEYLPLHLPIVHPSPRNRIWQTKNPWFEAEVVPTLQKMIRAARET